MIWKRANNPFFKRRFDRKNDNDQVKDANPYYIKPMDPNPYYSKSPNPGDDGHSDFAFVALIPVIAAAVAAGAAITTNAIQAKAAKRQQEAQAALIKLQNEANAVAQEAKAKQTKYYFLYGFLIIMTIGIILFVFKKKT